MTSVVFPSELANLGSSGEAHLAGRVVARDAEHASIGDAFCTISIRLGCPTDCQPGDLIELLLHRTTEGWAAQKVLQHRRPESPDCTEFRRLREGERGQILRARSAIYSAIRRYFEGQRFVEVETPTFVPSPGLDPYVHSLGKIQRGERLDYLITSPEFHMKRLVVGGMPRIYQFARCFRAEELGSHHEPEFTLLEWYRAFADVSTVMRDTEEVVRAAFCVCGTLPQQLQGTFEVMTVQAAFTDYAGVTDVSRMATEDPERYFSLWVDCIEPALAKREGPVFLTRFPLSMAALAQPCHDDPRFAERFELYYRGLELCNGYGELTDPGEQRVRFEREIERRRRNGEPLYPVDERFLAGLREGLPRASGNALGVDRLIALSTHTAMATGTATVAETMAFSDAER
jgi:elongation factor P--(R)-beta-lysine ligase